MGKSDFHEKKQNRIDSYKELSGKAKRESNQAYKESHDMVSGIPMGQPIIVGHHSEKAHRNLLDKSWNKMGKSVELDKKAKYYAEKAQAAEENTAISSDDPNAIEKLRKRIKQLEDTQKKMKAVNRICRSKKLSEIEIYEKLIADFNLDDAIIHRLLKNKGYPSYKLSNNNQNINRLKNRLKGLQQLSQIQEQTFIYGDTKVVVNVNDNRIEIYFPEKPNDEFRKELKRNGFRWSPTKGAWQMQVSTWNIRKAKELAESYLI